jgi:tetratricopeptide (TPR) repeat protein
MELTVVEKTAGSENFSYSMGLMSLGYVYLAEKKYEKAEPYIQKAMKIHEQLTGPQKMILVSSKHMLCRIYEGLGEAAKSEPCNRELVTLMEPVYGANNAALAPALAGESKALRELGRSVEADDLDRRRQSLEQTAPGPKSVPNH